MTGFFKTVKFEFSDTTLKMFAYDLNTWVKEANENELNELKKCKLRFTVADEVVLHVNKKIVRTFRDSFPEDYFSLEPQNQKKEQEKPIEVYTGPQMNSDRTLVDQIQPTPSVFNVNLIEVIEYLLEYIALFDFVTDLMVTLQLFSTPNPGWAIATTVAMVAPLLVTSV